MKFANVATARTILLLLIVVLYGVPAYLLYVFGGPASVGIFSAHVLAVLLAELAFIKSL